MIKYSKRILFFLIHKISKSGKNNAFTNQSSYEFFVCEYTITLTKIKENFQETWMHHLTNLNKLFGNGTTLMYNPNDNIVQYRLNQLNRTFHYSIQLASATFYPNWNLTSTEYVHVCVWFIKISASVSIWDRRGRFNHDPFYPVRFL